MRSIRIGDRKLSDMEPEEFLDFVYKFGHCSSDEYWEKPVLMQFEHDKIPSTSSGQIYFTFYQLKKDDKNLRNEWTGHIFFGDGKTDENDRMGIYIRNKKNINSATTHPFSTTAINHFLKLGFDLPLYSDFCIEW